MSQEPNQEIRPTGRRVVGIQQVQGLVLPAARQRCAGNREVCNYVEAGNQFCGDCRKDIHPNIN